MRNTGWITLGLMVSFATIAAAGKHQFKVTQQQARTIALNQVSGKIVHSEVEREHGRWIYSIEVRPTGETGKRVKEINIDANSGKVVAVSTEQE